MLKEELLRYSGTMMLKEQLRYIGAKGIAKRAASKVQWSNDAKRSARYIGAKGIAKRGAVKVQWSKRGLLKGKSYLCSFFTLV